MNIENIIMKKFKEASRLVALFLAVTVVIAAVMLFVEPTTLVVATQ